jgi:superfamily II DNA/RNA helicase
LSATFADLGVPAALVATLDRRGITQPFPIQAATLRDALAGHDIAGRAPTGSGKTLAFGLALVAQVPPSGPRRPSGLVLVPTRELAEQVRKELAPLAAAVGRSVLAVYGGVGYGLQRSVLDRGVDIVVACPGRLEDLIAQRAVDLSAVRIAVLDEADRMADMGFLPAVRRLLDATPAERQTLLFSATLDGAVDVLVRRYQRDPRRHEVEVDDHGGGEVRHLFWRAEPTTRVALTADIVGRHRSAIVFCRTKHGADRLVKQLGAAGVPAVAIHGNRSQPQRERALATFAAGRARALVATDVAARGIHVDAVGCVVHFDPPADHKDYVHRSGRTGRAGESGTVVSLVLDPQVRATRLLQRAIGVQEGVDRPQVDELGGVLGHEPVSTPAPRNEVDQRRGQARRAGRPDSVATRRTSERRRGGDAPGHRSGKQHRRRARTHDQRHRQGARRAGRGARD